MNSATLRIAVAQMCSRDDYLENLLVIQEFIRQAEGQGADLVCFPENCFYRGPRSRDGFHRDELLVNLEGGRLHVDSEFTEALAEILSDVAIGVSFGSLYEKSPESKLPFNTHVLFRPKESLVCYRKIHLFKFQGQSANYDEGKDFGAGEQTSVADFRDWKLGLSICFDLRFPEQYRRMALDQGAEVLLAPSAFTFQTGEAHWTLLNRARAVENQVYVASAGQWGQHVDSRGSLCVCFGNSLIVDPWGEVLAQSSQQGDGLLFAELKKDRILDVRGKLPSFQCYRKIS